jgi:hypothetical protein
MSSIWNFISSNLFITLFHKLQINKMFHHSVSKLFFAVVQDSTSCFVMKELWKCLDWSYWMINPFQSNFSATRILPSSYLFWAGKRLVDYYKRKSVGQAPTAERENKCNKKKCRTSSNIGAEQENHNVGRGPTLDRKGLKLVWFLLYHFFCVTFAPQHEWCVSAVVQSVAVHSVCELQK